MERTQWAFCIVYMAFKGGYTQKTLLESLEKGLCTQNEIHNEALWLHIADNPLNTGFDHYLFSVCFVSQQGII